MFAIPNILNNYRRNKSSLVSSPEDDIVSNNKEVCDIMNKSNHEASHILKKYFPDLIMNLLFRSSSSYVCVDSTQQYVIKIFKATVNNEMFDNEVKTYKKVVDTKHVLHMLDYHKDKCVRFIVLPYAGTDVVELINTDRFYYEHFKSLAITLVEAKEELVSLNIVHGDIKLENVAFMDNEWKVFDLGLSYSSTIYAPQQTGTVPNLLPQVIHKEGYKKFKHAIAMGYDSHHSVDYYAVAMTLLSSLTVIHHNICKRCKVEGTCKCDYDTMMVFNIDELYAIHMGYSDLTFDRRDCRETPDTEEFKEIVRSLIGVLLSKMDVKCKTMTWGKGFDMFDGVNKYYNKKQDDEYRLQTTKECWDDLKAKLFYTIKN